MPPNRSQLTAVVMAAGEGSRLRPLTERWAKPILPIDGRPVLATLLRELERAGFTSAARCLADDLDALVVHLRYPLRHRKRWRSTNLLERTLG